MNDGREIYPAIMIRFLLSSLVIGLTLSGCVTHVGRKDTTFQTSTIDALIAGVYDGDYSCRDLLKHGNLGIGTFDALDGEMLVVDGQLFQVKSDGRVYKPSRSIHTPFATVCHFRPESRMSLQKGTTFAGFEKLVDQHAPNQNLFYAIKIKGRFKTMHTRSVPRQTKPYPPLNVVTATQPEFHFSEVSGIIVGFRCPAYVKGVNVPGYHLHFMDDAQTRGGHILNFEVLDAEVEIDELTEYHLRLPSSVQGFAEADLTKDRSRELKAVEKGN